MADDSSHDVPVAQIEAAIETGDLAAARRLIETAEAGLGSLPVLDELRRRLDEVLAISTGGAVELALERARGEVRRANYAAALEILQVASQEAPNNAELRSALERTTRAAMRHESAVERNQAVARIAEEIEHHLDRGEFDEAAQKLSDAGVQFGKHTTLQGLQERLEKERLEAELEMTHTWIDQTRAMLDRGDWRSAQEQAGKVLKLDADHEEARRLERRAAEEVAREEAKRHHEQAIAQVTQDVERLMAAEAPEQASRVLHEAIGRFGRTPAFEELDRRLDEQKAGLESRKRLEWSARRLKEAEALVKEAGRLSLQGQWEAAIERLEAARERNPDHPEIEPMVQAAQKSLERTRTERQRVEQLTGAKRDVLRLLDDLHLDSAEVRLRAAVKKFGEDSDLDDLATRLRRLRASGGGGSPAAVDPRDESTALARQRDLAAAYSWKQILLYPFRGDMGILFVVALAALLLLELVDGDSGFGLVFRGLRYLAPLLLLALAFDVLRETVQGKNRLVGASRLVAPRRWGLDLALVAGVVVTAASPLVVLLLTRGYHELFTGWWGFAIAALWGWLAAAAAVLVWVAAGAFGTNRLARFPDHLRSLFLGEPETLIAINLLFTAALSVLVLRVTFLPFIPWLGSPIAVLIEVYTVLLTPHLLGVVVRRHRIELTKIYG